MPGEVADRIILEAGKGEYIEEKRVFLEEEVKAYWGDFVISLQDVLWQPGLEGAPGIISTEKPVHFKGALWNASGSGMELHPDTKLEQRVRRGQVKLLPDSETEALYLAVVEHLASMGVHQYEVSNFCRPGLESRHNQNYWRHRPWLGLGPGAHGYWGRRRYANHDDIHSWLAAVESGELPESSVDEIDGASMRLERLILRLRTKAGLPIDRLPAGALDLARGQSAGLWQVADGRLVLTSRGFLRIDSIEERLAGLTL